VRSPLDSWGGNGSRFIRDVAATPHENLLAASSGNAVRLFRGSSAEFWLDDTRGLDVPELRDITRIALNVIVGVVGVIIVLIICAIVFSRPPLEVRIDDKRALVDTRDLGEYRVSCSLIEVVQPDGAPLLRLTSPTKQCQSYLWEFVVGYNNVPEVSGDCVVEVPRGEATFQLKPGISYRFTMVGNNFFGHATRATRRFSLVQPKWRRVV
jgi:hypothetical protein